MEPMSAIETHLYQNVALGSKMFRDHCVKLVRNNETKSDKVWAAKQRAMCYIVITDFIF